jgi:hypothetical protein
MNVNGIKWPPHKAGMHIQHNPHLSNYETVAEYAGRNDDDWASEAEMQRAINTGELWLLQWYPETPVGFCSVVASSLQACLDSAMRIPDPTPAPEPLDLAEMRWVFEKQIRDKDRWNAPSFELSQNGHGYAAPHIQARFSEWSYGYQTAHKALIDRLERAEREQDQTRRDALNEAWQIVDALGGTGGGPDGFAAGYHSALHEACDALSKAGGKDPDPDVAKLRRELAEARAAEKRQQEVLGRIKDVALRGADGFNLTNRLIHCGQIANAALTPEAKS